ncbi:hypothetical protein JB92DRAFT_2114572 [Gautieria morchelliformis]|nr:hypothetical protein JB92DRAFT_2114572 [Gautieria morchelliformis]
MEYVDQADVVPGVRLMYEVTEVVDGREQGFLYVRDRHDGEQEKRYHTVERSGSRWDVTAEMPCPGGWPVFESAQNGPGERDDQEDGECNRKSKDRNEGESGKADVIITGESHPFEDGTVPIPCRIFGRIRSTDGLVVFRLVIQYDCISSPRKARRPELAFVFRGYLVGGMALVGRWRAASTNMQDPRMYDGPFYLCKVEPTDG